MRHHDEFCSSFPKCAKAQADVLGKTMGRRRDDFEVHLTHHSARESVDGAQQFELAICL